jgi:hypothetical protein
MPRAKAVKKGCLDRNSLLLLLQLYKEYIESIVPFDCMAVMGLINMCPFSKSMNLGSDKQKNGYAHDGHVWDTHAERMTRLDSIVPPSWLFGSFLKGIEEGTINVDEIASFKKHMSEPWAEMLKKYRKLGLEDDCSEHGSFFSTYIPPTPVKKQKSSGAKKPTNPGGTAYLGMLQGLYSWDDRKEVKKELELTELDGITDEGLGITFGKLVEEGCVKAVSFHNEAVKTLYMSGNAPAEGVGQILLDRAEEIVAEKEAKKKKKTGSPKAGKRKRDGTDKTSPNRRGGARGSHPDDT